MKNYATEWKKYVNFKELSYNDFIIENSNISNAFYLEKIDSMLGMLIYEKGKIPTFQTTTGAIISDLPCLDEYFKILSNNKDIKFLVLAGEICVIKNNKLLEWGPAQSIIKTSYIESNKNLIHHYVYDIFLENDKQIAYPNAVKKLHQIFNFSKTEYIHFPEYDYGGIKDFSDLYKKVVNVKDGIEGVVIRTSFKNYKIKLYLSYDVVVIGAGNESMITWNRKQISYLIVSFLDENKNYITTSHIGTGFTHKERELFYNFINENKVMSKNGEVFCKPKLVVEVNCKKFLTNLFMSYKYEKQTYLELGKKKSISLIDPRFSRIRTDKNVNDYDVRISQILNLKR